MFNTIYTNTSSNYNFNSGNLDKAPHDLAPSPSQKQVESNGWINSTPVRNINPFGWKTSITDLASSFFNGLNSKIWKTGQETSFIATRYLIEPLVEIGSDIASNFRLIMAFEENDFKTLADLARKGFHIHADAIVTKHFARTMEYAIQDNRGDDVKDFLSTIDINAQNNNVETLLYHSVNEGLDRLLEKLLAFPDINLNMKDMQGYTALMLGIASGKTNLVQKLVDHPSINLNIQDIQGNTALMLGIASGKTDLVQKLADHPSINLNIQDINGNTALMVAISFDKMDIANILAVHPMLDPNIQSNGNTALMVAILLDKPDIANMLAVHPLIKPNLINSVGETPLFTASKWNRAKTVNLLLANPLIDPNNTQTNYGMTALLVAECYGHLEIANAIRLTGKDTVSEDIKNFKILGHSWEYNGKLKFRDFDLPLEGFPSPPCVAEFMDSTLKTFQQRYPDLFFDEQLKSISHGLDHLKSFNAKQALNDFKTGKTIYIRTGSSDHVITAALQNSLLMICNKGMGSICPIEAYKIDPDLVSEEILLKFSEYTDRPYVAGFEPLKKGLLQSLNAKVKDELCLWLENLPHASRYQKVGNCAWESPKTAVYATMALQAAAQENLSSLSATEATALAKKTFDTFSKWDKFTQLEALIQAVSTIEQRILKNPETKDSLIEAFQMVNGIYQNDREQNFWDQRKVIHNKLQGLKELLGPETEMSIETRWAKADAPEKWTRLEWIQLAVTCFCVCMPIYKIHREAI